MDASALAHLLAIRELPAILPKRQGRRIALATVYRWVQRGVRRGPSRVKLPAVRVGGLLFVDPEDLEGFLRIADSPVNSGTGSVPFTVRAARARAERRAEELGL